MLTVVSLGILFSFLANKYSLFIKSIGIQNDNIYDYKIYANMRGSRGGSGGPDPPPPPGFGKLNITDITGSEKNSYYLRLNPPPPWKNFLDPRPFFVWKKISLSKNFCFDWN